MGDSRVIYYWGSLLQCKPVITANSKLLAALGSSVKVFSATTGNLIKTLQGHKNDVVGISLIKSNDPNEQEFLTCDDAGKILHWNIGKNSKNTPILKECSLEIGGKRKFKVSSFISRGKIDEVVVGVHEGGNDFGDLMIFSNIFKEGNLTPSFTTKKAKIGHGMFSVSDQNNFIAWLSQKHLNVKTLGSSIRSRHYAGGREITCVTCHPSQHVVATGDCSGRILVWYNLFETAVKKELHWHSLPVSDLVFSCTGVELYSGGAECVLVKWQLVENKNYFLPRVGMPIKYVLTDATSNSVICAHVDSGFTVVSAPNYKISGTIQGVSLCVDAVDPYPAGIVYDSRTKSIVLNGKSGHLQFYDLTHNKLLYQLDIVRANYINPERYQRIYNVEVEKIAMSPNGKWLATIEYRDDFESSREVRLKFWSFSDEQQSWFLNTGIETPHDKYVNGLMFDPSSESDNAAMCVSCSDDGKFKIWEVVDNSDIYKKSNMWNCRSIGFYRHLPSTAITIAPDGSLVAAGFSNILTLWTTDDCHLKGTLSQPFMKECLRQVEFGRTASCGSMVVTRSENWLCGWNLFTCSLSWRVMINSTCMAVDPMSSYMVVFSKCDAFIFEPQNTLISTKLEGIISKPAASAVFVPRQQKYSGTTTWNEESQLFIVDKGQRLKLIEPVGDIHAANAAIDGVVQQLVQDTANLPAPTPFTTLVAQTRASDVIQENRPQVGKADFGLRVQNSSVLLDKVLSESRVYRLDSLTALAGEFFKLVIPESNTSEEILENEEFSALLKERNIAQKEEKKVQKSTKGKGRKIQDQEDSSKETKEEKVQKSERKRKKKKDIERGLSSQFSDLFEILSIK